MATGDDALAAGMPLVNGATAPANTLDTITNETRDYIAQGKLKDGVITPAKLSATPVPIAKGGTGGTTAADARAGLSAVESLNGKIGLRWDSATLSYYPRVNGNEAAYLLRVDQGDARYVRRAAVAQLLEQIRLLTARVEALEAAARR